MDKKIIFIGTENNEFDIPEPVNKNFPEWFKSAKRKLKGKNNEDVVTWKGCPALHDVLSSGYVYKTPCDIEIKENNGKKIIIPKDSKYLNFIIYRGKLVGYQTPKGCLEESYVWQPRWRTVLPSGYSALFIHPMNRSDLPFNTVSGIIDGDIFSEFGSFPFFIDSNFIGTIPAGTPYMQIVPFKRESWDSEVQYSDQELEEKRKNNMIEKLRVKNGGVYFKEFWTKKFYR